jgi:hypothetical protein
MRSRFQQFTRRKEGQPSNIFEETQITYEQLHSDNKYTEINEEEEEEVDEREMDDKKVDGVGKDALQQMIRELTATEEKKTKEKEEREEWEEDGVQFTRNYMNSINTKEVISDLMREAHAAGGTHEKLPVNCSGALQAMDLGRCHKLLRKAFLNPAETLKNLDTVTPPEYVEEVNDALRAVRVQRVSSRTDSDGEAGRRKTNVKGEREEEVSAAGDFKLTVDDVHTLVGFYQVLYHTYNSSFAQKEVAAVLSLLECFRSPTKPSTSFGSARCLTQKKSI